MILGDIVKRNARRYPHKPALIFHEVRLSFAEFYRRVNSMANGLRGLGMNQGDRVGILLDNCHQYAELYLAIPAGGGIAVPVNTALSAQEIAYILQNADVNILVFGERLAALAGSLQREITTLKTLIVIGTPTPDTQGYEQLISQYTSEEPEVSIGEQDVACLLYTSGTTGVPKGAMITHRGMIESALNCLLACHYQHDDIVLVMTPLFWSTGILANIMPLFYTGGTVVITDDFSTEGILEVIQKEKITVTAMAPPTAIAIAEHPGLGSYDISSLCVIILGGGPMPLEAHKRAIKTMGNIFYKFYALSETGPASCLPPEEQVIEGAPDKMKRLASSGREATNIGLRVVNEEGRDVLPGQVGEVIIRGDSLTRGYWRMPQATEEALKGGYIHTGDLASLDEDGYLYLVGRKKDLIVSHGKTIYAVEVEEVIGQHTDVVEVAVMGIPQGSGEETIKAIVVIRGGAKTAVEDILEFCRERLPDYACPESVTFMDKLPRNPSGKVLKRVLLERYGVD